MVAGREPQITKFMENIGFANVFEGWCRKTLVKPSFCKNKSIVLNHVAGSTKFLHDLGFTNVFEGWSRETSVTPTFSKKTMVFNPCEHEIHG